MKLMVLDGNSLVNRAFFGIKLLTTKDGRYTNAIYGFQNILLNLLAAAQARCCGHRLGPARARRSATRPTTATRPPATACPRSWPSRCPY